MDHFEDTLAEDPQMEDIHGRSDLSSSMKSAWAILLKFYFNTDNDSPSKLY